MMPHSQPVLFFSHGAPLTLLNAEQVAQWGRWGAAIERPKAALILSAHWQTKEPSLGQLGRHEQLIYDFSGFPKPLYQVQYPAPGAPWLAERLAELLGPITQTERRLDHGAWVPLVSFWPEAQVPLLQLSLPQMGDRALFEWGQRLAPLCGEGVVLVGSGAVTHNLAQLDYSAQIAEPQALAFDAWVAQALVQESPEDLLDWRQKAPLAQANHPSDEHFLPLLWAAGAAWGRKVSFPMEGFEFGNLSRRGVQWT
ncbi:MAG: class III extradiol ring-cleavage dioxygenase [bacterium]|nr:class III extradiol ring-cleavage dioxygenase [bacterium]